MTSTLTQHAHTQHTPHTHTHHTHTPHTQTHTHTTHTHHTRSTHTHTQHTHTHTWGLQVTHVHTTHTRIHSLVPVCYSFGRKYFIMMSNFSIKYFHGYVITMYSQNFQLLMYFLCSRLKCVIYLLGFT